MKKWLYALSCSSLLLAPVTANAYLIFFDEDINRSSPTTALSVLDTPRSNEASVDFQANLSRSAGTQNFGGTTAPSNTFTYSNGITATFKGGTVNTTTTGTTSQGQYSAPSSSSTNYWQTTASRSSGAGTSSVNFSEPVSAIGFYAIDLGEFGGQLQLEISNNGNLISTETVPNSQGADGDTDGSVLFYGIIAENPGEIFTDVNFVTTIPENTKPDDAGLEEESFAIDEFTVDPAVQVVQIAQLIAPNNAIPNPATLALFGLGLAALGWSKRKA